jgi:hypothetical protein
MIVTCRGCGQKLKAADSKAGQTVDCPKCHRPVRIVPDAPVETSTVPDTVEDAPEPVEAPLLRRQTVWATPPHAFDSSRLPGTSALERLGDAIWSGREALLLATIAVCVAMPWVIGPPGGTWEYHTIYVGDASDVDARLSELGNERWELVTARRATGGSGAGYECIFKRPR